MVQRYSALLLNGCSFADVLILILGGAGIRLDHYGLIVSGLLSYGSSIS